MSKREEAERKFEISLSNNYCDKLISAGMTVKHPKNIDLIGDVYKELFKEEIERRNIYNQKPSEGEEFDDLCKELSDYIKEQKKKEG